MNDGFDERLSKGGFYGAGIYFTEHGEKADEYAFGRSRRETGCETHKNQFCTECVRCIILCRVNLGRSFTTYEQLDRNWGHPPENFHR